MTSTEEEWGGGRRERRLSPLASFRYRNYRWLWAANVCFGLGEAAMRFSLAWLAFEVSNSTVFFGLSLFLLGVPALVLVLPAGVWADRKDRRLLLITSHVAVALALLLTALLGSAKSELVLLTAFLTGTGLAIGAPVRAALVPALVPANRLMNGNAVYALGLALGAVAGPALSGVAITLWGVEGSFALLAAVMGLGALLLIPLRVPPREPVPSTLEGEAAPPSPLRPGMWESISEGFGFIFSGKTVVSSLFLLLLVTALASPWLAVNYAKFLNGLDINSETARWLVGLMGAASLASLFAIASIPRLRNAGGWYLAMAAAGALLTVAISFSSSFGLTALLMVPYGLVVGASGIIFLTLVQSATPITLMGRVMAIQSLVLALGAALGGIATAIDREAGQSDAGAIAAGAVIVVAAVAIVARNPRLRRMPSHPEERDEAVEAGPG